MEEFFTDTKAEVTGVSGSHVLWSLIKFARPWMYQFITMQ